VPSNVASPAASGNLTLLITGPPASSKGKLLKKIVKHFNLQQINTVGAIRMRLSEKDAEYKTAELEGREPREVPGSQEAEVASECTRNARPVPAGTMASLLDLRLQEDDCNQGWVLDGYPREKEHSEALLKAGISPNRVVVLRVPEQVLIDSQCNRRVDPEANQLYDIRDDIPEDVRERLVTRDQDQEEVVKSKIAQYNQQTKEMLSVFDPSILIEVDGTSQDLGGMFNQVKAALASAGY